MSDGLDKMLPGADRNVSTPRPRRSTRAPKSETSATNQPPISPTEKSVGQNRSPKLDPSANSGLKSSLASGAKSHSGPSTHTPSIKEPQMASRIGASAPRGDDVAPLEKSGAALKQTGSNQSSGSGVGDKGIKKGGQGGESKENKESRGDRDTNDTSEPSGSDAGRSENAANEDVEQSPSTSNDAGEMAKGATSNATGIDYSDKSMKDQLEHQAADVVMDATPVLGQFNSARKALKEFNKAKKDAGGKNDGITDKAEDVMDDGVDKGIKGVKMAAGAGLAGGVGTIGAAGLMLMQLLKMLKGMILAVIGKVVGFFGSIFSAMSSFFSGVLGVATVVGQAIAAGVMAVVVAVTSVLGFGVVQEISKNDDTANLCVPVRKKVAKEPQDYIEGGEVEAVRKDNAVKLWSVYSELGGSKEQTAAVLGNLQAESSLDPTAVETIYNEPFAIGSRKQSAIQNDFRVELIDSSYASRFPAINYVGIGLAQWTNDRNRLLIDYAAKHDVNWYEFDTQVRFMLDGDDPGRQKQLTNFLKAEPGNVQNETERFMNTWIGLSSPNSSLSNRQTNAIDYMFILERATADTDYANSILSGINVSRSEGNSAAGAYHQDDGCGNPIKDHYGDKTVDGTGEVPSDLTLVPWSRETLPASLKEYAKNPEDAGLAWGNASGWTSGIIPDQCAALAHSYFIRLYPDWDNDGRATTRPFGDGKDVADLWANHYGEKAVAYPTAGAVFSDTTTSVYGHTGIVQHVFANGDILINEQNIRGVSGAGAGLNYSWSWRVIKKGQYEQANWKFFKPSDAEPQWTALKI